MVNVIVRKYPESIYTQVKSSFIQTTFDTNAEGGTGS